MNFTIIIINMINDIHFDQSNSLNLDDGLSDICKIQLKRNCQVSGTGRQIRSKEIEDVKLRKRFAKEFRKKY